MAITIGSIIVSLYLSLTLVGTKVISSSAETLQSKVPNKKAGLSLMDFGYKERDSISPYISFEKSILAERIEYSSSNEYNI